MGDKLTSADGYLEIVPESRREALAVIRSIILEAIPAAEESMRYGMPTYNAASDFLAAAILQKQYMSL